MKVLVAEDGATLRRMLVTQLRHWDYDVTEAADGEQAWELFQQDYYPLVLTDWMMPRMDGLELTRRIRSVEAPGYVYVVLLTAKTEKDDLVQAMEGGADDFLVKPCDPQELRVRLREGVRIIELQRTLAEQNRKLRETQVALLQTEKLASLGQLAAGMAHEINNPIAYVTNNLAVLKRDVSSLMDLLDEYHLAREQMSLTDPELDRELSQRENDADLPWIQENLPRLFQSSQEGLARVRDIVQNLRSFARVDEAEYDELDVAAALESTISLLNHDIASRDLTVTTDLESAEPILCHPAKINQVLHNVLLNAVQASARGGTIEVRLHPRQDSVSIEIEDHGSGMDATTLSRIFEPFFTTRPVGSGTGLGLAISYGVIRDHGGSISVCSQQGTGSVFRIVLPYHPGASEVPAHVGRQTHPLT